MLFRSQVRIGQRVVEIDDAALCRRVDAQLEGKRPHPNKELVIVPGAVHTDLYDGGGKDAIPFDKIAAFFERQLR